MQHIVVGIDGSDESWRAIVAAREIAIGTGAAMTCVHADHLPSRAAWGLGESLDDVALEEDEIRTVVADKLRELNAEGGVEIGLEIVKAKPAEVILQAIDDLDADLVVLGHRGHGRASKHIGSVAEDVLKNAAVSVLIVR